MSLAIITGSAGFIGSHLKLALERQGHRVIGLGRGCAEVAIGQAALAGCNVEPDLIISCSGGSSVGKSVAAPLADFQETVPPFAELLEFVRTAAPAAKVVYLSSAAVYGDAETWPTDEDAPARPISPYGQHKRMCEELCASYGRNYGVRTAIVRLFSVYGPGLQKQLLWDACTKATAGQRQFSGTGEELRDWLHVDDAVSLILAAAGIASAQAPIINGGSGVGTSVAHVVAALFAALDAGAPQFSGGGRPGDPQRYVAAIARARSLGWRPRIELAEGLAGYVRWFKDRT